MLQLEQFIKDILLDANDATINEFIQKSIDMLWYYECDIFRLLPAGVGDPLVSLPNNIVEIIVASYNRTLLTRADEHILSSNNPNWRNAVADTPVNYLYRNTIPQGKLYLHPPPNSNTIPIHVIATMRLTRDQLLPWQELFVALRSIELISISDPIRAREKLKEIFGPLSLLVVKGLNTWLPRLNTTRRKSTTQ